MTKELKPCPFCGDTPSTGLCGERVMHDCKTLKAFISCTVEDWNTRYKRTCRRVNSLEAFGIKDGGEDFDTCSLCARKLYVEDIFCSGCGAEVVDD